MSFAALFLFFFGAIGIFNSFLTSFYFILKKGKQKSTLLFGLFLFFISERALRSLIYFFSPQLPNFYTQSEAISFVFIGPFLLLYVISMVKPTSRFVKNWKYYILMWIFIAIASHQLFPFKNDQVFWKKYILTAINIQWLCHILISVWFLFKHSRNPLPKNEKNHLTNSWLGLLLLSVLLLWLLYFFVNFTYFVVGSIAFSALFYSFFLFFIFNKKERSKIFKAPKRPTEKKIDSSAEIQLLDKIEVLMREKKPYKNPNLKSSDIANELDMSTHRFSQFINGNLGKSFSVFINEYRIEEAKQIIRSNSKYTLEAIGNESGFNSKSMFYKYFKSVVGMTPKKYREAFLSSQL